MPMSYALGIDIGGSGVKGAPVDLEAGEFAADRLRIDTPAKSTPANIVKVVAEIVANFAEVIGDAPVGVTIPAPVRHGVVPFIANLDKKWVNLEAEKFFSDELQRPVTIVNDADAAGVAEVRYGAAKGQAGVVIVTTLGTGIGTAIINNGILLPNTELGHLEIDGYDAEKRAAASAKTREDLSYKEWSKRLQRYYETLEKLFWPDLFVVGGRVSKNSDKFLPNLQLNTPIVPAQLRNSAGIIGAAALAVEAVAAQVKGAEMHSVEDAVHEEAVG